MTDTVFTVAVMLAILCVAADVAAQTDDEMAAVMPSADRFEEGQADPPIKAAYVEDRLIGYVFRTQSVFLATHGGRQPSDRIGAASRCEDRPQISNLDTCDK